MSCSYYRFGLPDNTTVTRLSLELSETLSMARSEYEQSNIGLTRAFANALSPVGRRFTPDGSVAHLLRSAECMRTAVRLTESILNELDLYEAERRLFGSPESDIDPESVAVELSPFGFAPNSDLARVGGIISSHGTYYLLREIFITYFEGLASMIIGFVEKIDQLPRLTREVNVLELMDHNLQGNLSPDIIRLENTWNSVQNFYNAAIALSIELDLRRRGVGSLIP